MIPLEILCIRMLTTAFVVIAVSWSVGVFGPLIGGALAGLPIVLGPGFYFLSREAPAPFVADTAAYALLSLCATQLFITFYIATAKRDRPFISLFYALAAWTLAAFLLRFIPAQPWAGVVLFIGTTVICLRFGARFVASPVARINGKASAGLLIARGVLAGGLVAAVTTSSQWLGPAYAGLLMAFPIGYTVMAVTIHQIFGAASVIAMLHSALLGTASLASFCATLALTFPHWSRVQALGSALLVSSVITTFLVVWQRYARRRRASFTDLRK